MHENSYLDAKMTEYCQWLTKEEKIEDLDANIYVEDVLQDKLSSINVSSSHNRKIKCKPKQSGICQKN